jgi:hypothetical protein
MTTPAPITPTDLTTALLTAEQAVAALVVENRALRVTLRDVAERYHELTCWGRRSLTVCVNPTCRAARAALEEGSA